MYDIPPGILSESDALGAWIVENSRWRRERYHYIGKHDLDQRIPSFRFDLRHHLFTFADEAVEALAEGCWLEQSDTPFTSDSAEVSYLELPLPPSPSFPLLDVDGLQCEVQENPNPHEVILRAAQIGSQPLYRFCIVDDGDMMTWTVNVRFRGTTAVSVVQAASETVWASNGVLTVEQARAIIVPLVREFLAGRG